MYEIRPESLSTFIKDRNVKLPRFQRKQTWDAKKNFQLCISIFKNYPIGVCILSVEEENGKTIRWLLDGRQRRNALTLMLEDPENIYNWAKAFVKFKNNDQPSVVEEKFWAAIDEFLENDDEVTESASEVTTDADSDVSFSEVEGDGSYFDETETETYGLDLLLEIIKLIHNKTKIGTGFTAPFNMSSLFNNRLPFVEIVEGKEVLSSRLLKIFIDQYKARYNDDYLEKDCFAQYMRESFGLKDECVSKFNEYLNKNWNAIKERIEILDKIENQFNSSRIGMIEVKSLNHSDAQKIFNIINTEGEKLKAVEVLSAKPRWNISIPYPSAEAEEYVKKLYKDEIGVVPNGVVRWDMAATFMDRAGENIIYKKFLPVSNNKDKKNSDFEKKLTLGFKSLSALFVGEVTKDGIDKLSAAQINWERDIEALIFDVRSMFKVIGSSNYFKYLKSWNTTIMELTSDAVALDFFAMAYKDWQRKGKPMGQDANVKAFQKNCFILWDKLVYEYVMIQWKGASDHKIAKNLEAQKTLPEIYVPVKKESWMSILTQIYEKNTINDQDIRFQYMKCLLYHFYCLNGMMAPNATEYNQIDVDHIIPQSLFKSSTIDRKDVIVDNVFNLGLLPKEDNISKSDKPLSQITNDWLKQMIEQYEFVNENDFQKYSNVSNYQQLFSYRKDKFDKAFGEKRDSILNN